MLNEDNKKSEKEIPTNGMLRHDSLPKLRYQIQTITQILATSKSTQ